jgi:hypothetical protein
MSYQSPKLVASLSYLWCMISRLVIIQQSKMFLPKHQNCTNATKQDRNKDVHTLPEILGVSQQLHVWLAVKLSHKAEYFLYCWNNCSSLKKLFRVQSIPKNHPNVILFWRFHRKKYSGAVGF